MANQKKLQKAATKFRKENPKLRNLYSGLISGMANYITKSGAAEVTVGLINGAFYAYANDQH